MFKEGDLVTPKSGKYYSDLSGGKNYKVQKVNDKGQIQIRGSYSTNYYATTGFNLVERAAPAEPVNFIVTEYPNITVTKGSAATYDKARTVVESLLKKNPFGEFAILGVVDRAKLDFAPVRWSNDPQLSPVELNETSVYTPIAKGFAPGTVDVTIVGTLKDRLAKRS